MSEKKNTGIPARKLFTTTVEDASPPKPTQINAKTLAEQAAGKAALEAYRPIETASE